MPSADITIASILKSLNTLAPFALAEDWDNVGLLVGAPDDRVSGIMIGLDPTPGLLVEALAKNANLVITHHPVIFSALKSIRTDQPTGALLAKAIRHKIAIIACHTNLDVVPNGVSHILAQRLGLTEIAPLTDAPAATATGSVQVGNLAAPVSSRAFLANLCQVLGVPAVSVAGPLPASIERVAVCGGSGSEFAHLAQTSGAQLYVTAEVKHHTARWAEECRFCIIDAGHYATEHLIVEALASALADTLANQRLNIPVHVTEKQKNPFSFFMTENDQQPSNERYGH
jgi:dinuclear metal center YbgI/SA1388 family protein